MRASVGLLCFLAICCLLQCILVFLTDHSCTTFFSSTCTLSQNGGKDSEFNNQVLHCLKMELHGGWRCILNECNRPQKLNQLLLFNLLFNMIWFLLYIGLPESNLYLTLICWFCEVIFRGWLILGIWNLYNDWYLPWNLDFHPVFPNSCIFIAWIHLMCCLLVPLVYYWKRNDIHILSSTNYGVYRVEDDAVCAGELKHKAFNIHLPDVDVSHV